MTLKGSTTTPLALGALRESGIEDATRRTRLANERTFLAWWRSGLTAIALAFAVGRIAPDFSKSSRWPCEVAGIALGILGALCLQYGYVRVREVENALNQGSFAPFQIRVALTLAALGVVVACFAIVAIVVDP
jgi:putative membrane protein